MMTLSEKTKQIKVLGTIILSIIYKMKHTILLVSFALITNAGFSQRNLYAGQYIGWMKMFNAAEQQKPYTLDHRQYSVKQMAISQAIVNWVQQSYTPKGALGQAFRLVNDKLGLYNQQTKSLPQVYGALTKTYLDLKKEAQNKWVPETNTNWFMQVAINGKIGDFVDIITTPEQYFFYIPGENKLNAEQQQVANLLGFPSNSYLKKYISWYQPKGIRTTLQYVVLLCKDNQKPYVQLTRGEYLDHLGKAIERDYAERIAKIKKDNANDAKSIQKFSDYQKEAYDRRIIAFNKLRENHKNKLTEKAAITQEQPDLNIENSRPDIFDGEPNSLKYAVYKFDQARLTNSKTDIPQWIVISWDAEGVANNDDPGTHLHQSMLENIDYDYIYNYFFDPEKVKGVSYKPRRSATYEEKITAVEKSDQTKKNEADAGVAFFEDFSNTPEGKPPVNWTSTANNDAQKARVEKATGEKENWVVVKGQTIKPTTFKKILPLNFTASFDIAVPKGFTWGAKALEFWITNENPGGKRDASIQLRLRPGFDGRDGAAQFNIQSSGGNSYNDAEAYQFSNDKLMNRVSVVIKKSDGQLQLFINNKKLIDKTNILPAGTQFNQFWFHHINSDAESEKYYITNIKISKD